MNERAITEMPEALERQAVATLVPHRPRQQSWWSAPATLGEAMELAKLIADSEFAPKDYRGKAASVLIAIRMGNDVGLSPMQSLQNIAVINGRPAIWGDAALALVQSSGVLERFHETAEGTPGQDAYTAVCIAKRKGLPDEVRRTFSIADARRAGLWGKTGREGQPTPWVTYPYRMLQMRARGFTLRDVAADRLMGLILAEEAMDIVDLPDATTGGTALLEGSTGPSAFDRVPEALRDNLEKAFDTLSLSPGMRMAKLHEFLGLGTPEEGAKALLEWCKDEYAKRKTGKPRTKGKEANGKPTQSGPVEAPPAPVSVPDPVPMPPPPEPVPEPVPDPTPPPSPVPPEPQKVAVTFMGNNVTAAPGDLF
jgi:hypothetical protein